MSKALHISAMVTGSIAVVLIIVALATSNMVSSCFNFVDYYDNLEGSPTLPMQTLQLLGGISQCYQVGLFSISTKTTGLPSELSNTQIDGSLKLNNPPAPFKATSGLLISSLLLTTIGLILFHVTQIMANAKKLSTFCFPILIVGVLFAFGGAMTFTITQYDVIDDPVRFYTDLFAPFLEGIFSEMGIQSSPGNSISLQDVIEAFSAAATTHFDFSFYLMWIGFVVASISAILSIIAYRMSHSHVTNDFSLKDRI